MAYCQQELEVLMPIASKCWRRLRSNLCLHELFDEAMMSILVSHEADLSCVKFLNMSIEGTASLFFELNIALSFHA